MEAQPANVIETADNNLEAAKRNRAGGLTFHERRKDEDSGYLADGIVEDLITEFSMIREFERIKQNQV